MNNVSLTGRITKDPELRYTPNQKAYIMFTIAVDRGYKDVQGNKLSDFIPCVAWGTQADFIGKYVKKGNLIEITGNIQSRMYQNQQGENRVIIEVVLNSVSNLTPKPKEEAPHPQEPSTFNPQYQKYQTPQNQNPTTFTFDDEDFPF